MAADRQQVVFENEQIRAVRYNLGPRESAKIGARRSLLYCLSSSVLTAKVGGDQERLVCDTDIAIWNDSPLFIAHREGGTAELLVVEVKASRPVGVPRGEDDASTVVPLAYGVMFENEHLRVLRFRSNAGQSLAAHSHPGNLLRYSVTPLRARVIGAGGAAGDVTQRAGVAEWFSAAERHTWENLSNASEYAIVVEVK